MEDISIKNAIILQTVIEEVRNHRDIFTNVCLTLYHTIQVLDTLRYWDPEDRIFNRIILDISVALKETTLTISDSIETGSPETFLTIPDSVEVGSPVKTKIMRVVSLNTMEIIEIT